MSGALRLVLVMQTWEPAELIMDKCCRPTRWGKFWTWWLWRCQVSRVSVCILRVHMP
jgi:hypothetical protein